MKWLSFSLMGIASVASVVAQSASQWCTTEITGSNICFNRYLDFASNTSWAYIFPETTGPLGQPANEFVGVFIARSTAGWIGASLGGGMRSNPLVLGWINGRSAIVSLRRTEQYAPPAPLTTPGPVVTLLGGSGLTTTGQQRIIFRVTNATAWQGGSNGINLNNAAHPLGFALHSSAKPNPPNNPAAGVQRHTLAGQHTLNIIQAKNASYWDTLQTLQNLAPLP